MKNLWTLFFFTNGLEINLFDIIILYGISGTSAWLSRGCPAIILSNGRNAFFRNCISSDGNLSIVKTNVKSNDHN
jgi:hypothetical protein